MEFSPGRAARAGEGKGHLGHPEVMGVAGDGADGDSCEGPWSSQKSDPPAEGAGGGRQGKGGAATLI